MILGIIRSVLPNEKRVALLPSSVEKLIQLGCIVMAENGLGGTLSISDQEFEQVGAKISTREAVLKSCDMIVSLSQPRQDEVVSIKKNAIFISFLDPFSQENLIDALAARRITAISMEMLPRTTVAQKMDALSSQASLAGYVSIILAAGNSQKIFPMMMTPSGTIPPARVFVIGAGVAGLQAIATAKRLGARVEAFDTRPVVEEQVQSLGAKFVKIDLGETGQTQNGYAHELTAEQLDKQRQAISDVCAQSDIVITTAQVFGKKAPLIITQDIIKRMKSGSVIVDMAVESGGNVEGSKLDQEVVAQGVKILGFSNLAGRVASPASQMYSNNLTNLITSYWFAEEKRFNVDMENEFFKACVLTFQGKVVNPKIKKA